MRNSRCLPGTCCPTSYSDTRQSSTPHTSPPSTVAGKRNYITKQIQKRHAIFKICIPAFKFRNGRRGRLSLLSVQRQRKMIVQPGMIGSSK